MTILSDDYYGNLTIDFEATLNGNVFGNILLKNAVILVINGEVNGDIKIDEKSRAIIYGKLIGAVHNHGICEVYGKIEGELFDFNQSIFIDEKALIIKKE